MRVSRKNIIYFGILIAVLSVATMELYQAWAERPIMSPYALDEALDFLPGKLMGRYFPVVIFGVVTYAALFIRRKKRTGK